MSDFESILEDIHPLLEEFISQFDDGCFPEDSPHSTHSSSTISAESSNKLHDAARDELLAVLEGDGDLEMSVEDKVEKIHKENKDEESGNETNPNTENEPTSSSSQVPTFNILNPNIDTLIDLTDERQVVTIKVEPVEKVIVIDDEPCVMEEKKYTGDQTATEGDRTKKEIRSPDPKPSTSSTGLYKNIKTCKKVEPLITIKEDPPATIKKIDIKIEPNDTDKIVIKSERQDEPAPSTSCSVADQSGTEKKIFLGNEAEDGEVVDDVGEIPVNSIVQTKREPMSLTNPALSNVVAAAFGGGSLPQHALYTSLLADYQISKMAKSINKLTKYVSRHKDKKKSHKKKSRRKSKSKRSRKSSRSTSRSRSRSRSRSATHNNKPNTISPPKKTCRPKQYRSRSPSQSPSRGRHHSSYIKYYRSNSRLRSSSRSLSKSPERKRHCLKRFKRRPYSRSPSMPRTKTLVVKKDIGKRSPLASPPRRKRRYSSSLSSSTDTSSSSPRYKRRRRRSYSSRSRSRSRSRTPKKIHTTHSSKIVSSTPLPSNSIRNLPSTSQQTIVAQQTYQQEFRQGNNVMTRKAIVTTSFKEELKSFKNSLVKPASDSPNDNNVESELNKLELTVFDIWEEDVTSKRPDGDLNHPFYIHPEDAELYQMKCRNGLQPLQALHEICVKCSWKLPNYMLLPTPKGFRFGLELNGHRFVTEKTAQQKKLAKAAAALIVLQWLKIVSISPAK